jgi:hypothetical protein
VEEPPLVWRAWPAAERPAQAIAVGLALFAAAVAGGIYGRDPLLAGVSLGVLFCSLSPYYLPTRIRIDERGIETANLWGAKRRAWESLRSYAADQRGITVSPYRRSSLLEAYRGLRLLYGPAADRQAVLARVASRLQVMEPRVAAR